jgi:hypothetical protein
MQVDTEKEARIIEYIEGRLWVPNELMSPVTEYRRRMRQATAMQDVQAWKQITTEMDVIYDYLLVVAK